MLCETHTAWAVHIVWKKSWERWENSGLQLGHLGKDRNEKSRELVSISDDLKHMRVETEGTQCGLRRLMVTNMAFSLILVYEQQMNNLSYKQWGKLLKNTTDFEWVIFFSGWYLERSRVQTWLLPQNACVSSSAGVAASLPAPLKEGVGIQAGCPWLVYKSQALYCHPHNKGLQLAWNCETRYHWNAKQEDSSISNDHWQHTGSLSWSMIIFQTKFMSYRIYPSERHMSVTALEISPRHSIQVTGVVYLAEERWKFKGSIHRT